MNRGKRGLDDYPKFFEDSDENDSSPSSLMIEMKPYTSGAAQAHPYYHSSNGASSRESGTYQYSAMPQQHQHHLQIMNNNVPFSSSDPHLVVSWTDKQRARDEWQQIIHLDRFLEQTYEYFHEKGLQVILFNHIANLCMVAFIVFFFLFLFHCVDYDALFEPSPEHHKSFWDHVQLSQLLNLSFFWGCCLFLFLVYWISQIVKLFLDYPELERMHRFYNHLLEIADRDLPTLALQDVINRISQIQEESPISVDRLNPHDIANRIMRKENYLIALFNKDVLNLSLPVHSLQHYRWLTKTLEWNLSFCIMNYIFDENNTVRSQFLKDTNKEELVEELKKRFVLMGFVNCLLAPFIVVFLIVYFAFRYGEEFYRNPRNIGMRQYTPLARWKFREFNELPHLFDRRLNFSYKIARRYMNQYSNAVVAVTAKFAAFVLGSMAFVIIVIGIVSEDLLLSLEITSGRTLIWYLGVFGILIAVCRSLIPDDTIVYDPALLLNEIIKCTHFLPHHWRQRLHTDIVRKEFGHLFDYKISIFGQELLGVLLIPFILWRSLPSCASDIIDFFREFTVHVDGIGYVCSFAVFDFKRHGNPKYGGAPQGTVDKYHRSRQGKMEKSFLNFTDNYPEWIPNEVGSMYLEKLKEFDNELRESEMVENSPRTTIEADRFAQDQPYSEARHRDTASPDKFYESPIFYHEEKSPIHSPNYMDVSNRSHNKSFQTPFARPRTVSSPQQTMLSPSHIQSPPPTDPTSSSYYPWRVEGDNEPLESTILNSQMGQKRNTKRYGVGSSMLSSSRYAKHPSQLLSSNNQSMVDLLNKYYEKTTLQEKDEYHLSENV